MAVISVYIWCKDNQKTPVEKGVFLGGFHGAPPPYVYTNGRSGYLMQLSFNALHILALVSGVQKLKCYRFSKKKTSSYLEKPDRY